MADITKIATSIAPDPPGEPMMIGLLVTSVAFVGVASGALVGWRRSARRRERMKTRARVCQRALEVVAAAESLADLVRALELGPDSPALWARIQRQRASVAHATTELDLESRCLGRLGTTTRLSQALTRFNDQLRRRLSHSVTGAPPTSDAKRPVFEQLRRRVDEVVETARFVSIVAHIEE